KFELSSVPAGIPTWFIARSHRFTTHTHWRLGALFADSEEEQHLGLIEAYPHEKIVRLTVRGPAPHNFFTLLRDGLELTLARFPGLKV
ncbi:MAG: GTPase, partial [candidate division Zixibacteria bacterium]|nr:GTPase [candidate division Zixibacteria bacterium]NIR63516.1 GTPase [candidate division Zixibacteria bacterium]NIS45469.1 GTPase [candidate division Zixibacteria bacterium]NIU13611.1 GTPase [candidate division Zixibacteria bacterium]NIV05629.1 GTPase [candidate division Zixibacteria bacterium]